MCIFLDKKRFSLAKETLSLSEWMSEGLYSFPVGLFYHSYSLCAFSSPTILCVRWSHFTHIEPARENGDYVTRIVVSVPSYVRTSIIKDRIYPFSRTIFFSILSFHSLRRLRIESLSHFDGRSLIWGLDQGRMVDLEFPFTDRLHLGFWLRVFLPHCSHSTNPLSEIHKHILTCERRIFWAPNCSITVPNVAGTKEPERILRDGSEWVFDSWPSLSFSEYSTLSMLSPDFTMDLEVDKQSDR